MNEPQPAASAEWDKRPAIVCRKCGEHFPAPAEPSVVSDAVPVPTVPTPTPTRRAMPDTERPILTVMGLIADLALALDAAPLHKHPGCWEHQVDKQWWIALNGHGETKTCSTGAEVEPYHCYVQYNGWPAGIINPYSGTIAAGEAANEEAFIEALKKAIAEATHARPT